MRVALLVLFVLGCAPTVDGPVERQRSADRDDARALEAQLATLPGAARATVTLHRAVTDPLGVSPPSRASASVLLVVDDKTDRAATTELVAQLVRAAAPDVASPAIVVVAGIHRAELAKVGPFTVDKASAGALKATLAMILLVVLALSAWIALRYRRGNSAQ